MKLKLPKKPSAACEKLREVLIEIYAPIQWEKVDPESTDLTSDSGEMTPPPEILFTARSLALELNAPLSQVLRVVHRGLIKPAARSTAGAMLFSNSQLAEIKNLIKSKS
jgi:hypothetical protein